MKLVVAPESTRATACDFLPCIHSVTGNLNEDNLFRAMLLIHDSSTQSGKGTLFSTCRVQDSTTGQRENPPCGWTLSHTWP